MVDRPDWTEAAPVSNVPGLLPLDPAVPADVRAEYEGNQVVRHGEQAVDMPRGIGPELRREMTRSMDGFNGFEENVAFAQQNAIAVEQGFAGLGVDTATLNAELDKLPTPLLDKVRRVIWKNPGIQPLDLLDRIERTLTLEEQALAEAALRRLCR